MFSCREEAQCLEEFLVSKQIPFTKDTGSASTRKYLVESDDEEEDEYSSRSEESDGEGKRKKKARLDGGEEEEESSTVYPSLYNTL